MADKRREPDGPQIERLWRKSEIVRWIRERKGVVTS
jgi:hypothetical protein